MVGLGLGLGQEEPGPPCTHQEGREELGQGVFEDKGQAAGQLSLQKVRVVDGSVAVSGGLYGVLRSQRLAAARQGMEGSDR